MTTPGDGSDRRPSSDDHRLDTPDEIDEILAAAVEEAVGPSGSEAEPTDRLSPVVGYIRNGPYLLDARGRLPERRTESSAPEPPTLSDVSTVHILVVCTGNVCRSPMAAAFLRDRVSSRGLDVGVSSAGFVRAAMPPPDEVVTVMAARGLTLDDHRSTMVTDEMLGDADLIIGMAREHVRNVTVQDPSVFEKTFTLKELVRRGGLIGPRGDEPLDSWLIRLGQARERGQFMRASAEDDVADPIGRSKRVFRRTGKLLEELVDEVMDLLFDSPE